MAQPKTPQITTTDLRTEVPAGWAVTGLSAPKFDGVNFFRTVTAPQSSVRFQTPTLTFTRLEFQLYSPTEDVTGVVALDGREVGRQTYPAGKFTATAQVGAFAGPGAHGWTVTYQCQGGPCQGLISQYWTQMAFAPPTRTSAIEDAGLGAQRWWGYAPATPLTFQGLGPLLFDGANYARRVLEENFKMGWSTSQALNASLHLVANQPFRVTTRVEGQVVSVQRGDAQVPVSPTVSLVDFASARQLSVKVECLGRQRAEAGCAYLYFPKLAVSTVSPATTDRTLIGAVFTLLLLVLLWRGLGVGRPPQGG